MRLYKWLYMHTPFKRPFTYVIRDARRDYPTPWMLGVLVIGAIIGHYFWSLELLWGFCILLAGILWGHLWFGSKDIPNQQGK